MELINQKGYTLVHFEKTSQLDTLIDFLKRSSSNPTHLIIDFSDTIITDNIVVNRLLPFHFILTKHNQSFILISTIRKKFLKELVSLPSLEEAVDFFHMDLLTRNI